MQPDDMREAGSRFVPVRGTRLYVVERGQGFPLLLLHGGPGLDHHEFADYLDDLADRYHLILVDQRAQGRSDPAPEETWTLEHMAQDVSDLAAAMGFAQYAVLGHSYGAFVALKHATQFPGAATATIVSSGVPSARFLAEVEANLAAFQPESLRQQVTDSWAREQSAETQEDMESLMRDQMPFHFADPFDPRIAECMAKTGLAAGGRYSPAVLRHFAQAEYGGIEVEDALPSVTQPVLVLAGRFDRTCIPTAAEAMAHGLPNAELAIFEHSGHMTYIEEQQAYLRTVRDFLDRHTA
jgi:pimeloyl-ACP methyl ester carboxylesterase